MLVQHTQKGNKGVFFVQGDEFPLAELVYTKPSTDKMILEHTEVSEQLKGQNVGFLLVEKAVEYAREHNIKIIPLCPFANAVIHKTPAFQDVLFT
ncbi:MAG TPA: GNAT family N-acetyltransferase [Flavihumibacter sp.]